MSVTITMDIIIVCELLLLLMLILSLLLFVVATIVVSIVANTVFIIVVHVLLSKSECCHRTTGPQDNRFPRVQTATDVRDQIHYSLNY